MKVTILVGGRWHAFDLAAELHRQGHLHRLITNYPTRFVKRWGIPPERVVSLPVTFMLRKLIYWTGGEALMMRCQWRVHRWFAERAVAYLEGSELIHGWSQWSEPSLRWARERGVPTVLERSSAHILEQSRLLHEEHSRHGLAWTPTHPQIEAMELREYALATAVAVPSLFVQETFLERGFDAERLWRNGFGVDLGRFRPPPTPPPSPEAAGLRLIFAGTLSLRKGIPDLLAGFAAARLPGAQLTLLGGLSREVEPLLRPMPSGVTHLDHQPQAVLPGLYGQHHAFVMTSVEEGMAMVQLQALACGLPLICSRHTGGEDLLRRGDPQPRERPGGVWEFDAGFVVPIHAPEAIGWCLRQLAQQSGLWARQRQAALALAQGSLGWDAYARRATEHYRRLMGQGHPEVAA